MGLFKFFWILFLSVVLVSCNVTSNSEKSPKYEFIKVSEINSEYGKPGSALNCFVENGYLYISCERGGVKIYDISDTKEPKILSSIDEQIDYVIDVFVNDNYLYVADAQKGLLIFDITQKDFPKLVKTLNLNGSVQDIHLKDSYAFVCAGNGGLYILDISEVSQAKVISNFTSLENALSIAIFENYAYVADDTKLKIIDITTKSAPKLKGELSAELHIENVFVEGNYLYVVDNLAGSSKLKVYDLNDPINLVLKATYSASQISKGLYVSRNYAFLSKGYDGVDVLDISDINNIKRIAEIVTSDLMYGLFFKDSELFVACDLFGVKIFDITENITYLSTAQVGEEPESIFVDGSKVYLALGKQGLLIVEKDENIFKRIKKFNIEGGNFVDIFPQNNFIYVADLFNGLRIIDISDPNTPFEVGKYQVEGDIRALKILDNHAFISAGGRGILVVDISNSRLPSLVKELRVNGIATCLDIQNKYLYVGSDFHGLEIYDISEPTSPRLLGKYNEGGQVTDLKVSDNFAYIAYYKNELHIVDVSNPKLPKKLAVYTATQEGYKKLGVYGKLLIAADSDELQILIFDSKNFKKIGGLKLEGIKAFRIVEDYAYVCSNSRSILNLYKIIQK